jgi:hypothetical protein
LGGGHQGQANDMVMPFLSGVHWMEMGGFIGFGSSGTFGSGVEWVFRW